jgi:hypothetical protein
MKPDEERLLFEHDLATPITNLQGASYLLRLNAGPEDGAAREALDILDANIRTLERMTGWYWRARELESGTVASSPWDSSQLPALLAQRIASERVPLPPPSGDLSPRSLAVPQEPLLAGLIGAGLTLAAASGETPVWQLRDDDACVGCLYSLKGAKDALDPERLFRKFYWPSRSRLAAWLDPGLPYLRTLLDASGGALEMRWADGTWELAASIPAAP